MNSLKWLLLCLIILLLLIFLIVITKITILINYHHSQDDDRLDVKIKAWFGLIKYKISVPIIKIDDDSAAIVYEQKTQAGEQAEPDQKKKKFSAKGLIRGIEDTRTLLTHIVSLHRIVRSFLRKVSLKDIKWQSVIGIGDAAITGTLTGGLWAVKGGLLGVLSNYFSMKNMPELSITPSFLRPVSQTRFQCMIQFRIGYAMLAGIKLVKYWKGGRPKFQSNHLKILSKDKSKSV